MNRTLSRPAIVLLALGALPLMLGASGKGCGNEVSIGNDGSGGNTDPCAGQNFAMCPAPCPADYAASCGQSCLNEGETCGNDIGDGRSCTNGVYECVVHAPLSADGCNQVCLPIAPAGCTQNSDCPAIEMCVDCGNGSCGEMSCVNGQCELGCSDPGGGGSCTQTSDCAMQPAICMDCGDGTCASMDCIAGTCQFACNGNGGSGSCTVDADCPALELCQDCGDGTCAATVCLEGICRTECAIGGDPGSCSQNSDCVSPAICMDCGDGTCAVTVCLAGVCELTCTPP